jgi:hypothetical protein
MRFIFLLCLGLLLVSCEDFFNQELTGLESDYEPELSLFALLQPQDSLIMVDVRRTIPTIGGLANEEDFRRVIEDAEVTISDGRTTVPLVYLDNRNVDGYVALTDTLPEDFLQPGGTYTIEAQHEDLRAGGTVSIPLDSITREDVGLRIVEETSGGFTDVLLVLDIPNQPGEEEYYVLISERSSAPNFDRRQRNLVDWLRGRESLGERLVFEPVSLFEFTRTTAQLGIPNAATHDYLSLRQTALDNNENPCAEPTILPSNVENGVGHLGGLNCQFFTFNR